MTGKAMRQSCVNFLSFLYEYEFEIYDLAFFVADTQLYKRLCPSAGPSVGNDQVEMWKNKLFGYVLCKE